MPDIKPFRGWRYDLKRAGKPAQLVAPPYDIISPAQQEKLYSENPNNAIRLELAKDEPGDTSSLNKYTRAAETLNAWKREGVLVHEGDPALYVYEQIYREGGKTCRRIGFMAAMKADDTVVKKHEDTLAGPKADRLKLIEATRTNLSPIWGLFEDPAGVVNRALQKTLKRKPEMEVNLDGVKHRLFVEARPEIVKTVVRAMKPKPMFIADGHHRFETACTFARLQSRVGGGAGTQYVLTYFSDVRHNPFKIYPTHRLLKVSKNKPLLEILNELGAVKSCKESTCLFPTKPYQFGFYSKKEGFLTLTLSPKIVARIDKKNPVDRLDVAALHRHVIAPCFGIEQIEKSPSIDFTRDAKEAVAKVKDREWDLAIFLRPTSLDEMILASKKGLKMPQKSTYFYPKLLTGLVFRSLDD